MAEIEAPVFVAAPPVLAEPAKVGDKNTAPTTTAAQDLITAGQRTINKIWEITQATIVVCVTLAIIYLELSGRTSATLSNAFAFIVATYLTRSNHTRIGGVVAGQDGR